MNREEAEKWIAETYHVGAEYLWPRYPGYCVFRRADNQKWFALLLDVPKEKLGLSGEGVVNLLNVKCDPIQLGSFLSEPGILPAYHMNKSNWLSIVLDGETEEERCKLLLDLSFRLTAPPGKRGSRLF